MAKNPPPVVKRRRRHEIEQRGDRKGCRRPCRPSSSTFRVSPVRWRRRHRAAQPLPPMSNATSDTRGCRRLRRGPPQPCHGPTAVPAGPARPRMRRFRAVASNFAPAAGAVAALQQGKRNLDHTDPAHHHHPRPPAIKFRSSTLARRGRVLRMRRCRLRLADVC